MLYIEKKQEPNELIQEKRKGLTDYSNLSGKPKEAVQVSLLEEQGCLCAYCMRRISLENVQIEHYLPQHPQSENYDPALTIDYRNMLAVCSGNKKQAGKFENLTCDQHRGNEPLTVDPRDPVSIEKIKYKTDGTICSSDAEIEQDLNITLNLNCPASYLKENRKAALDAVKQALHDKFPGKKVPKQQLERMLKQFQVKTNGRYAEFAGVIIWYLKRQIARV